MGGGFTRCLCSYCEDDGGRGAAVDGGGKGIVATGTARAGVLPATIVVVFLSVGDGSGNDIEALDIVGLAIFGAGLVLTALLGAEPKRPHLSAEVC